MGYHRAGFEVVGVDVHPQPHYPFEFHQGDALSVPLSGFDAIHASPPCQAFSTMAAMTGNAHPDLLTPTRERLRSAGVPYVIENVPGAPGPWSVLLCGTMFGLGVIRHRYFLTSWETPLPDFDCNHDGTHVGVYGDHVRGRGGIWTNPGRGLNLVLGAPAMGIQWMTWPELTQAIPPAYTEWIGRRLMRALTPPPPPPPRGAMRARATRARGGV